MNSAAIVTRVQTRNVRCDQFAFSRAERRVTTQENFVVFEQRPRHFWKRLKDLQQARLRFQRTQETHRDAVAGALTAALGRIKSRASFFRSDVGSWQTKFSQT